MNRFVLVAALLALFVSVFHFVLDYAPVDRLPLFIEKIPTAPFPTGVDMNVTADEVGTPSASATPEAQITRTKLQIQTPSFTPTPSSGINN